MIAEHFVTLFDSYFLPQGISLLKSMERHISSDFKLWVLCIDDDAFNVLEQLDNKNLKLMRLRDYECAELISLKTSRSRGEYCWTLTPYVPKWVFESDPSVSRVTYLDADTWFCSDPAPIFEAFEASNKDVLITEHAPSPEYDQTHISGIYCVQYITFNGAGGEKVRSWWEDRCFEWCYAVAEDGRFGDQKYLDEWPKRFNDLVYVYPDKSSFLAPWNASRFNYESATLYHFHGVRFISWQGFTLLIQSPYKIPNRTWKNIYLNYLRDLNSSFEVIPSSILFSKYKSSLRVFLKELVSSALRLRRIYFLKSHNNIK